MTKQDVQKAAQKYLRTDSMAIVVVGDQKSNEPSLRKITEVELRDLEGNPIAAPSTAGR